MSDQRIFIPQPKAVPGDEVWAQNYRTADKRMENGECLDAEFHMRNAYQGHWRYRVRLHRRSATKVGYKGRLLDGNVIILHVQDDGIEQYKEDS